MSTTTAETSRFRLKGGHVLTMMLIFFGIIFAANAVMIWLALGTFRGTEVASSYRAGRAFPAQIAAARAQAERNWTVDAHVERQPDGHASVRFVPRDAANAPLTGLDVTVKLQRPADSQFDRMVTLRERTPGTYVGGAEDVAAGQWTVVFEASRNGEQLFRSRNRVLMP